MGSPIILATIQKLKKSPSDEDQKHIRNLTNDFKFVLKKNPIEINSPNCTHPESYQPINNAAYNCTHGRNSDSVFCRCVYTTHPLSTLSILPLSTQLKLN